MLNGTYPVKQRSPDSSVRSDGGSDSRGEGGSRTQLKLVRIAEAPERAHGETSSEEGEEVYEAVAA